LRPIDVRDATEIARDITLFAEGLSGGLIITGSPAATVYRDLIVALAARHQLPAIYISRFYVIVGGLISYGPDYVDQFRRSAGYVDRILKVKASRLAGAGGDKIRASDQPQDARRWHNRATVAPRSRRRVIE
jgi:hypothetical protein